MASQIADPANLFFLGGGPLHHERVGVIESQLAGHPDAELAELAADVSRGRSRRYFEELLADRTGVFRIETDLIAAQCLPENDGAAHSLTVFHRDSGIF